MDVETRTLVMDVKFREALVKVWDDAGYSVRFDVFVDAGLADVEGVFAKLSYDSNRAHADGRRLLKCASNHTLVVSPVLLLRSSEIVMKYLLHEAIHVGYPEHDEDFERVAEEVGTASTAHLIEGGDYEVERDVGEGFKLAYSTKVRRDAHAFAEEQRAGPGTYRIAF